MTPRFPFRVVRTRTLDELQAKADAADGGALLAAAALIALQVGQVERERVLEHLDGITDDLQVHILRRALAVELLTGIDTRQMPAEQIRIAREALVRGGEEVTTS
ncbi:hypothetical protein QWJ26_24510 [Streptomyces sp. CSDS2]|uniref:hypothetical protein n=1 Tax=Streptomyces sp. CSDS2 TaxID=3055051 RepID=UPI0025B11E55|nr:hypothetical protein [Streptomyces sp. CSDS2]MDN3262912.1 hypothetical protein [Streptomyces sp. CSDS2]